MFRFTRRVAILNIGGERLVYFRDGNVNEIERESDDIIFDDAQFFGKQHHEYFIKR